jgi:iron(III) transport system permease protein
VVALLLLTPAVLTFAVDYFVQRKQNAALSARAVALVPRPDKRFDLAMTLYCVFIAALMLAMFGMAVFASFAKLWPYNLVPSLDHYVAGLIDAGLGEAMVNSIVMASGTALFGTAIVFVGAYLLEKTKGLAPVRALVRLMAMLPMAVPGLVLGLGYVFFINARWNPLGFLYGTILLLAINCIAHFYTTAHITAVTALKQIDNEFEAVSASLKVPFYRTFSRVTVPICMPAIFDIAIYMFVNALTTVSAVIFLYGASNKLASISIVHMDEAGATAAAAGMATLIVLTALTAKLLHLLLDHLVFGKLQAWRRR